MHICALMITDVGKLQCAGVQEDAAQAVATDASGSMERGHRLCVIHHLRQASVGQARCRYGTQKAMTSCHCTPQAVRCTAQRACSRDMYQEGRLGSLILLVVHFCYEPWFPTRCHLIRSMLGRRCAPLVTFLIGQGNPLGSDGNVHV